MRVLLSCRALRGFLRAAASALVLASAAASSHAQVEVWPSKPIRLIIPFPPGQTATDVFGRAMAERLGQALGQSVVVESRPGAGGTLGGDYVVKSKPDGYTLLLGVNGTIAIAPSVYGSRMPFDPQVDLQPIALFATVPYMLVVPASLPVKNVRELVALARERPGSLNFGSSGNGTTPHLCGEWFKRQAGIDIVHVPYKGGSTANTDLVAGRLQIYCTGGPSTLSFIRNGQIRAIGLAAAARSPILPEIPTLAEQGVAGMEHIGSWVGLFAPAGTPKPIINRIHEAAAKVMASDEMRAFIYSQAGEPISLSPAESASRIKSETAEWASIVQATGARPN